jgi:4-hydroxy-2-oxovalerate/4-hydroxy-2-oxohexanoate aldolase
MTLRDGMHPKRHLMTLDQMKSIACGLDAAGVPLIEVTHGDGLGGSSVNYGFPAHTDEEYLGAVIPLMKQAKVSALLLPGIGTVDHLKMAHEMGVHTIRVATHCTEADVSEQHITMARKMGMDTVGFLMMAHMNSPEGLVTQAKLMEGYGANCIYVTDSAGHLLPDDVKERLGAVREALKPETELGFHGHHNLAMGVANSLAAIECGATRIDAAAAGLGAGAGNTPMEVLVAVLRPHGHRDRRRRLQDPGRGRRPGRADHGLPDPHRPRRADAGLCRACTARSCCSPSAPRRQKYGVPARDILVELGRRGMVGGQEDMIEDTATELKGPGCHIGAVLAASDVVLPGIEVIDSRYRDFKFDLKSVVADNTSAARFVVGGRIASARDVDLRTLGVVLEKNGQPVAMGAGAAVLGHPAAAVAMLVNHLGRRGQSLPAGSLVLSGGITEAVAVQAGDNVTLRIQNLGSVSVRFV